MPEPYKLFNRTREHLECIENETLAPYAVRSKGVSRLYMENYAPCKRRTEFERDKDRIIYSLAFKRLMEKTQVYVTHEGDHYTNRLSHTLSYSRSCTDFTLSSLFFGIKYLFSRSNCSWT